MPRPARRFLIAGRQKTPKPIAVVHSRIDARRMEKGGFTLVPRALRRDAASCGLARFFAPSTARLSFAKLCLELATSVRLQQLARVEPMLGAGRREQRWKR